MANIIAWHGKTFKEHVSLRDSAANDGYRFLSLSIHGTTSSPLYTVVMIKRDTIIAQRDSPFLTADEFQQEFNDQAQQGFGPSIISAIGSGADPRFAVVYEPQNPIPLTRYGLKSGDPSDFNTIQGMNKKAKDDGSILKWASIYGDSNDPCYAAIWVPNTLRIIWNADGVFETSSDYQNRFNAQTSGWCRPSFVTLNNDNHYLSLFVHNRIGPWIAKHGMTSDDYQNEFDTCISQGYFPICVQGGGSDASTSYAALFVMQEYPFPEQFNAVGTGANADIDNVIYQGMRDSPVWNASLAIVYGKKLVYARGYSWGAQDLSVCLPTTRFRIDSVSKSITALAIYQLIEEGKLALTDKLQSILQLKTPAGENPKDPRFSNITIRHLLEHTSGIDADTFRWDINILNVYQNSVPNISWHLPVTNEMCDAYVASLDMNAEPGTTQAYNNCGYFLLGRVVAKKRSALKSIDAYNAYLFNPLSIHRIRHATSLIASTPIDEAHYRAQDIPVYQSEMSDDRPLVPEGYGTEQFERQEGCGGLSAAVTDLGRLLTILISPDDNPAMKRSTINTMMENAVNTSQIWCIPNQECRAGHGWDAVSDQGNNHYHAQKGGSRSVSSSVLQFNGDWGFAMCWGGVPLVPAWYPDYPAIMNIARSVLTNAQDLFPYYGMFSLLNSSPAVVTWGANRLDIFTRSGEKAVLHKWWDGSNWGGWESLDGILTSPPCAVAWEPNRLDIFALGGDRAVWHKWWDGSNWGGWESLDGTFTSPPCAVAWASNRLDIFALGDDRAVWHKWWDGSNWGGWESLDGTFTSPPCAVAWASNRLDIFALGDDRAVWHKWWDGSNWGGWESLDGTFTSPPCAVAWASNRLDIFALGDDRAVWHKWWDGSNWGGWESLDGTFTSPPCAVAWASNRLDIFALGDDRAVWHKWWDGSNWGGWESLDGTFTSPPCAVAWMPNRLDIFALDDDCAIRHKWWDGSNWGGWETFGI